MGMGMGMGMGGEVSADMHAVAAAATDAGRFGSESLGLRQDEVMRSYANTWAQVQAVFAGMPQADMRAHVQPEAFHM